MKITLQDIYEYFLSNRYEECEEHTILFIKKVEEEGFSDSVSEDLAHNIHGYTSSEPGEISEYWYNNVVNYLTT